MKTVTIAPVNPLTRLKARLLPVPSPTAADRARWKRIAADRTPVIVTDDAPDISQPTSGLIECATLVLSFPIPDSTAAWFHQHGGTPTLLRALRAYMRAHADQPVKGGSRRTAAARRARR